MKIFNQNGNFSQAHFHNEEQLFRMKFEKPFNFRLAIFDSAVSFIGSEFQYRVNFDETTFWGDANFHTAEFNKEVSFSKAVFHKAAGFNNIIFESPVNFRNSIFEGDLNFINTEFLNYADFENSVFNSLVDFNNSKLLGEINFWNITLPDTLNFSDIKLIQKEIDLIHVKKPISSPFCFINLTNSNIRKIKIDYNKFRLLFKEEDSLSFYQKENIYLDLLANYKDEDYNNSKQVLDVDYRKFLAKNSEFPKKMIYYVNLYFWEFGYSKLLVLNWIAVFLVIFQFSNIFIFDYLVRNGYELKFLTRWMQNRKFYFSKNNRINRFFFIFIYTLVIFFGIKFEVAEIKGVNSWIFIVIVEYIIGLVCTIILLRDILHIM